jgi:glycogen debranching enzyme
MNLSTSILIQLKQQALSIIKANSIGSATKPAPTLYPHQWNWDSAFIAIGLSHINQEKAQKEIQTLLKCQWNNGMIPHINFNPATADYHPGPAYWDSRTNPDAPMDIHTSGITQPPLLAWAAFHIYKYSQDSHKALEFLASTYPKLIKHHEFFLKYRNPDGNGLIAIIHPWESGLDNSPRWDSALMGFKEEKISFEIRTDINIVPEEERPTSSDYVKYNYLVTLYRKAFYDQKKIMDTSPFIIQPILFNSLFYNDLVFIEKIGELLGKRVNEIRSKKLHLRETIQNILWHEETGCYCDYDVYNQRLIIKDTIANYAPLFAGIPPDYIAKRLITRLVSQDKFWPKKGFPLTSVSMREPEFDPNNYWRGPVWINMNWLIFKGLYRYGFKSKARELLEKTILLVKHHGFYEYFNPITGIGRGTDQFSWTAALIIDLIEQYPKPSDKQIQSQTDH